MEHLLVKLLDYFEPVVIGVLDLEGSVQVVTGDPVRHHSTVEGDLGQVDRLNLDVAFVCQWLAPQHLGGDFAHLLGASQEDQAVHDAALLDVEGQQIHGGPALPAHFLELVMVKSFKKTGVGLPLPLRIGLYRAVMSPSSLEKLRNEIGSQPDCMTTEVTFDFRD